MSVYFGLPIANTIYTAEGSVHIYCYPIIIYQRIAEMYKSSATSSPTLSLSKFSFDSSSSRSRSHLPELIIIYPVRHTCLQFRHVITGSVAMTASGTVSFTSSLSPGDWHPSRTVHTSSRQTYTYTLGTGVCQCGGRGFDSPAGHNTNKNNFCCDSLSRESRIYLKPTNSPH